MASAGGWRGDSDSGGGGGAGAGGAGAELAEADMLCNVCRDPSWDDDCPILLCDGGCALAVHVTCHGVLSVPDDEWVCDACAVGYKGACALCARTGGMMKQVAGGAGAGGGGGSDSVWLHVTCALAFEQAWFARTASLDGLTLGDTRVLEPTRRLPCDVCGARTGLKLRCCVAGCKAALHASCAATAGLRFALCAQARPAVAYCEAHQAAFPAGGLRVDGFAWQQIYGLFDGAGVCNRERADGLHEHLGAGAAAAEAGGGGGGTNTWYGGSGAALAVAGSAAGSGGGGGGNQQLYDGRVINCATVGKVRALNGETARRAILPSVWAADAGAGSGGGSAGTALSSGSVGGAGAAAAAGTDRSVDSGSDTVAFTSSAHTALAATVTTRALVARHEAVMALLRRVLVAAGGAPTDAPTPPALPPAFTRAPTAEDVETAALALGLPRDAGTEAMDGCGSSHLFGRLAPLWRAVQPWFEEAGAEAVELLAGGGEGGAGSADGGEPRVAGGKSPFSGPAGGAAGAGTSGDAAASRKRPRGGAEAGASASPARTVAPSSSGDESGGGRRKSGGGSAAQAPKAGGREARAAAALPRAAAGGCSTPAAASRKRARVEPSAQRGGNGTGAGRGAPARRGAVQTAMAAAAAAPAAPGGGAAPAAGRKRRDRPQDASRDAQVPAADAPMSGGDYAAASFSLRVRGAHEAAAAAAAAAATAATAAAAGAAGTGAEAATATATGSRAPAAPADAGNLAPSPPQRHAVTTMRLTARAAPAGEKSAAGAPPDAPLEPTDFPFCDAAEGEALWQVVEACVGAPPAGEPGAGRAVQGVALRAEPARPAGAGDPRDELELELRTARVALRRLQTAWAAPAGAPAGGLAGRERLLAGPRVGQRAGVAPPPGSAAGRNGVLARALAASAASLRRDVEDLTRLRLAALLYVPCRPCVVKAAAAAAGNSGSGGSARRAAGRPGDACRHRQQLIAALSSALRAAQASGQAQPVAGEAAPAAAADGAALEEGGAPPAAAAAAAAAATSSKAGAAPASAAPPPPASEPPPPLPLDAPPAQLLRTHAGWLAAWVEGHAPWDVLAFPPHVARQAEEPARVVQQRVLPARPQGAHRRMGSRGGHGGAGSAAAAAASGHGGGGEGGGDGSAAGAAAQSAGAYLHRRAVWLHALKQGSVERVAGTLRASAAEAAPLPLTHAETDARRGAAVLAALSSLLRATPSLTHEQALQMAVRPPTFGTGTVWATCSIARLRGMAGEQDVEDADGGGGGGDAGGAAGAPAAAAPAAAATSVLAASVLSAPHIHWAPLQPGTLFAAREARRSAVDSFFAAAARPSAGHAPQCPADSASPRSNVPRVLDPTAAVLDAVEYLLMRVEQRAVAQVTAEAEAARQAAAAAAAAVQQQRMQQLQRLLEQQHAAELAAREASAALARERDEAAAHAAAAWRQQQLLQQEMLLQQQQQQQQQYGRTLTRAPVSHRRKQQRRPPPAPPMATLQDDAAAALGQTAAEPSEDELAALAAALLPTLGLLSPPDWAALEAPLPLVDARVLALWEALSLERGARAGVPRGERAPDTAADEVARLRDACTAVPAPPELDPDTGEEVHCIERAPHDDARIWVGCDCCQRWSHIECAGLSPFQAAFWVVSFACAACTTRHGWSTYVRAPHDPVLLDAWAAVRGAGVPDALVRAYMGSSTHMARARVVPPRAPSSLSGGDGDGDGDGSGWRRHHLLLRPFFNRSTRRYGWVLYERGLRESVRGAAALEFAAAADAAAAAEVAAGVAGAAQGT